MSSQKSDPCYTVTSLTREIRTLLESAFPAVRIRGEISNLRQQASGHIYFSLKDSGASISCVCFRNDAARLKVKLRDGLQIVGGGRVNVYEPRGNYQIIFRTIEEDGVGRLQQAFLELKQKLGDEGLFDKDRKRALPRLPRTVGFVTSETGAALRDFVSILQRRDWRGRLIVIPARVQGAEAAPEIVRGIEQANQLKLCDLLVIGRGGGSLEDLWPFNEEAVARAVAVSEIPIISAVGHEIDFTLSDFAADHRAETPSAAAELITSAWQQTLDQCDTLKDRLYSTVDYAVERKTHSLNLARAHLQNQHPRNRLEQAALRLDDLQARLGQTLVNAFRDNARQLEHICTRFHSLKPEKQIGHYRENLRQLRLRLVNNSHQATLNRGYAIVRKTDQSVLSEAVKLLPGEDFVVEMRDDSFEATRKSDS
nr:exodeoxyribonuclease VII large subunit [Oceanipulchritudo coccoides]